MKPGKNALNTIVTQLNWIEIKIFVGLIRLMIFEAWMLWI